MMYRHTAKCKDKKRRRVYKEERKCNQRGSKFIPCDPWVKTKKYMSGFFSYFQLISIRTYGQNKTIHNLYESLWSPYKAHVQNGISGSHTDAVFKLVVHRVRDLDKTTTVLLEDIATSCYVLEFVYPLHK